MLNADDPTEWGETKEFPALTHGNTYLIRWAPALIEALNELPVELVWTTTWRDDAPLAIGKMMDYTLPHRVLHPLSGRTTFPSINWKLESIIEDQLQSPSPFIWAEDEIGPREIEVAEQLGGLAIPIHSRYGITPSHLEQYREYLGSKSE